MIQVSICSNTFCRVECFNSMHFTNRHTIVLFNYFGVNTFERGGYIIVYGEFIHANGRVFNR